MRSPMGVPTLRLCRGFKKPYSSAPHCPLVELGSLYLDASARQWIRIWVSGPFWVLQGECLIFGALCPSKSGPMNKHIVKHIVQTGKTFMELNLETTRFKHSCTYTLRLPNPMRN